jgi:molybdate transport system substrate-binding protein
MFGASFRAASCLPRRPKQRRGKVSTPLVLAGSLIALLGLIAALVYRPGPANGNGSAAGGDAQPAEPLMVYCAASNKTVLEAIRADYEREYKTPVRIQYGPSQTLLASMEVSSTGDLYLPADDSYLALAREKGLVTDEFSIAQMQAVVAVAKGNPKKIAALDDLLRADVRLAEANPDASAIGKLTREALRKTGRWDDLHNHAAVEKTTVNDVANDVKLGSVDAGIVYDAVLVGYPTLEGVEIPELADVKGNVGLAVLKSTKGRQRALHFARYVTAKDKGLARYREFGFKPVEGDPWSDRPEITLYAGSMLRPAIEATITEFEEREGVHVSRVYNGCGILVAQMKGGEVPDAYFACDVEFMKQVRELFPDPSDVSQNELVILVQKGNPHGIGSLKDLTKPGLRVGIGHEKQCAMGWLTQRTFDESGMKAEVMKNVVVQTPTGDMLVNQMRSGSLDAAVAYLSNAAGSADSLDAIRIQGLPCAIATQPYAVAKDSPHKQLAQRLLAAIRAQESQERFASEGFQWVEGK